MLEINVKNVCYQGYVRIYVKVDDTRIDMGMLDKEERLELANYLKEVIDDLEYGIIDEGNV